MLVQVSFPPCCQLTLCNGVPRQAHAGISARSKLFKTFQPKISFCPDICCPMQNCGANKMSAILDWECCPPFPKNNKNRSLENFAQTFLPFPAFLFPAVWWNWTRICGAPVTLIGIHAHINIYIQGVFFTGSP